MSEDNKIDPRLMQRLTRGNWHTEFKQAYLEYALRCGEAGDIIRTEVDVVMRVPNRLMRRLVANPAEGHEGELVEGEALLFADDARGDRQYETYEKKYEELKKGKKSLIAYLLGAMDKEIKEAVMTSPEYDVMIRDLNLLGLYHLVEQVVTGRGAVSAYATILKLFNLRQDGKSGYYRYEKEFLDLATDITRVGDAQAVLRMIFNAQFVVGLDQTQFKDKLSLLYGQRVWPDYVDLMAELHTYVESTVRVEETMKRDEGVAAHVSRQNVKDTRGCFKCGSLTHLVKDCPDLTEEEKKEYQRKVAAKSTKNTDEKSKKKDRKVEKGKKPGNKSLANKRVLKQFAAHLSEFLSGGDSDGDDDDNEEESSDDETDSVEAGVTVCHVDENAIY